MLVRNHPIRAPRSRPPAWLGSFFTRNIWIFCLSMPGFCLFVSDWLIYFPHSESTNVEQQEITEKQPSRCVMWASGPVCSAMWHPHTHTFKCTTSCTHTYTDTQACTQLHTQTHTSSLQHTHTHTRWQQTLPCDVVLTSPPRGVCNFCGRLDVELRRKCPLKSFTENKLQNIQQKKVFKLEKRKLNVLQGESAAMLEKEEFLNEPLKRKIDAEKFPWCQKKRVFFLCLWSAEKTCLMFDRETCDKRRRVNWCQCFRSLDFSAFCC